MTGQLADAVAAAVAAALPDARADLERLVRIPSIWADPAHADNTRRCADTVAELAREAGAADVAVVAANGGGPAVIAHFPGPAGTPTVLLYAHHDVQPTGGDELWTSPPFEPAERNGRLYGRGAADDKSGVMAHLAVLRAYQGRPPVGVTLFIEGEEESGSPTLPALLRTYQEQLDCDVIVIADASNPAVDVPALTMTGRGIVDVTIEVAMLQRPVHSGVYGGRSATHSRRCVARSRRCTTRAARSPCPAWCRAPQMSPTWTRQLSALRSVSSTVWS